MKHGVTLCASPPQKKKNIWCFSKRPMLGRVKIKSCIKKLFNNQRTLGQIFRNIETSKHFFNFDNYLLLPYNYFGWPLPSALEQFPEAQPTHLDMLIG